MKDENPTREELERWAGEIEDSPYNNGLSIKDIEAIVALLRSYPLPAVEGERAELAARLRSGGAQCFDEVYDRAAVLLVQPAAGVSKEAVLALPAAVVREVAELPGRTSPEDSPETMLVTEDELLAILDAAVRALPEAEPEMSGDRERLLFLLTQACDFMEGGGTRRQRREWARYVRAEVLAGGGALPEAEPENAKTAPLA